MKKTLRNIGLAALLSIGAAGAPENPDFGEYFPADIYGKNKVLNYTGIVPENEIYKMINTALYWNPGPAYADAKYHRAIVYVESTDDASATSHRGAKSLRQNTRIAWESVTGESFDTLAYNPQASITVGIMYTNNLDDILSRSHPKWNKLTSKEKRDLNSAAYNGGITRLRKNGWDVSKMPKETRNYVKKVNKIYESPQSF